MISTFFLIRLTANLLQQHFTINKNSTEFSVPIRSFVCV